MNRLFRGVALAVLVTAWLSSGAMAEVIADLSDLNLGAHPYWNGSDGSGGFASQAIRFKNTFTDWGGGYTSWFGFSCSRVNDPVTPGLMNQYAVVSGTGVGGTGTYAVASDDSGYGGDSAAITLPVACGVRGFFVNNTTYAAMSLMNGDWFSKKFGGEEGADPDWFKLTITAQDEHGEVTGSTHFYLADFRFADNAQDYIVTNWTWVSLTNLGLNVKSLHFSLSSSDNGLYGMNTPAYFALDDLLVDPASPAFSDGASWDGSGIANLMAYVLGRKAGDTYVPELAPTNDSPFFEVVFRRRAYLPDAEIGVEVCTNLVGEPTWITNGIVETVIGIDSGLETIRARIPGGDTHPVGFARLRAWRK